MTEQQLEVRQRRAQEAPMVIQRTAAGFLVYSAASPSKAYHVEGQDGRLVCDCPDFQNNSNDPDWTCKHILAVLAKHPSPLQTDPHDAEERAAIQAETEAPRKQRARRTPVNGNGRATLSPPPNASPRRNGNGNGAAQMLIKRSISPDGRIDSVSVEFSTPVSGTPVAQIKAQALRTLKLQNEIADAFLNLNGNGKPKTRPQQRKPETEPPPSVPANEAVPGRLLDVGTSNGRYGPRLFISVQVYGKRYRLYGSTKQLAAYVGYAGQQIQAGELEAGLKLNIPCRVVLTEAGNGFVNVTQCNSRFAACAATGEGTEKMAGNATVLIHPEEAADITVTPHLSFSRINRYLLCPEQYRLYYIENLRPKLESANLAFGGLVHRALADLFQHGVDPVQHFKEAWAMLRDAPLRFSRKDSWESLAKQGEALLTKFFEEEAGKLKNVTNVEKVFEVDISNLDLPFIGVIDLVAELRGKGTVIDFKTSQMKYPAYEVVLADQLTAYKLGEPTAEQVALCIFVKTKKPRIEWHVARRTDEQLLAYLGKADYVSRQIHEGHFFLRPGKWCQQCDYLPICTGDKKKTQETLTQIQVP